MKNYQALKNWMGKRYHKSFESTIKYDGMEISGFMYGNDECFDTNEFYQYFLTAEGELYKAYFEIPEGTDDYGSLDYENPYEIIAEDVQFWLECVI